MKMGPANTAACTITVPGPALGADMFKACGGSFAAALLSGMGPLFVSSLMKAAGPAGAGAMLRGMGPQCECADELVAFGGRWGSSETVSNSNTGCVCVWGGDLDACVSSLCIVGPPVHLTVYWCRSLPCGHTAADFCANSNTDRRVNNWRPAV